VLASYLTYQAVRIVVTQLSETNPPLAIWLNGFSSTGKVQDGKPTSRVLPENQDLAFRIMVVREHLADRFPPEMTRTGVKANMEHRRQHLEQLHSYLPAPITESTLTKHCPKI